MEQFPREMTVERVHELVNEQHLKDFETFDDLDVAQKFAETLSQGLSEYDTQVYTQADGAEETVYLRGQRVVNRTGIYLVAWI